MLKSPECPPADSWRLLLQEQVREEDRESLELHLDDCRHCRDLLDELSEASSVTRVLEGRPEERFDLNMLAVVGRIERRIAEEIAVGEDARPAEEPSEAVPPSIPGFEDWRWIGRGGMGVVFKATQVDLNRTVAVKILSTAAGSTEAQRSRAIREALAYAKVQHPNVVEIHGSGRVEGLPYLVMEYIEGGTLQDRIREGGLSEREAAEIVRDTARAVAAAHARGVVHRDLKPANVLMDRRGDKPVPKLTDFGLARCIDLGASITETGMIVGTPSYMAPEQTGLAPKLGEVGTSADVHGLGAILYAALTGRPPYEGRSSWEILVKVSLGSGTPLRALRLGVSSDLANIVARCLERHPSQRYGSASALADDLDRFLEGRPVSARPIGPLARVVKWARRYPTAAALIALLFIGTIGATVAGVYHVRSLSRALQLAMRQSERASQSLHMLSSGVVQRFADRAEFLDEDDFDFLHQIRKMIEEPPDATETDLYQAWCVRAQELSQLAHIFDRLGRPEDARVCMLSSIDAAKKAPDALLSRQLRMNGLSFLFARACEARDVDFARTLARQIKEVPPLPDWDTLNEWVLNADWRMLQLEGYHLLGQKKVEEAAAKFEACADHCRERIKSKTNQSFTRFGLAIALYESAKCRRAKYSPDEWQARMKECHAIALSSFDVGNEVTSRLLLIAISDDWIASLASVGKMDEAKKKDRERLAYGRELLTLAEKGVTRGHLMEGSNGIRCVRAYLSTMISACLLRQHAADLHDLEPQLDEAVAKGSEFIKRYKRDQSILKSVAQLLSNRARWLASAGKTEEGIEQWSQGVALLKPLAVGSPRDGDAARYVCFNLYRISMIRFKSGNHKEALDRVREAIEIGDPQLGPQLHVHSAECRIALKDFEGARRDAQAALNAPIPQVAARAKELIEQIDQLNKSKK